jgi:hypothetical protein
MDFVSTIALLLVATAAQLGAIYWELTIAPKERHSYRNRLHFAIAGAIAALCIGTIGLRDLLARSKPDYDYAYLVPAGAVGTEAAFFFNATQTSMCSTLLCV